MDSCGSQKALGGSLVKTAHYPLNFIKRLHWERVSFSGSTSPGKLHFPGVQEKQFENQSDGIKPFYNDRCRR